MSSPEEDPRQHPERRAQNLAREDARTAPGSRARCRRRLGRGGPASSPARSRHRALFPRSRRASNPGVAVSAHRKGSRRRHFRFLLPRTHGCCAARPRRRRCRSQRLRAAARQRRSRAAVVPRGVASEALAHDAPLRPRARVDRSEPDGRPARTRRSGSPSRRKRPAPSPPWSRATSSPRPASRRDDVEGSSPEAFAVIAAGVLLSARATTLHEVAHERVIPTPAEHPVRVAFRDRLRQTRARRGRGRTTRTTRTMSARCVAVVSRATAGRFCCARPGATPRKTLGGLVPSTPRRRPPPPKQLLRFVESFCLFGGEAAPYGVPTSSPCAARSSSSARAGADRRAAKVSRARLLGRAAAARVEVRKRTTKKTTASLLRGGRAPTRRVEQATRRPRRRRARRRPRPRVRRRVEQVALNAREDVHREAARAPHTAVAIAAWLLQTRRGSRGVSELAFVSGDKRVFFQSAKALPLETFAHESPALVSPEYICRKFPTEPEGEACVRKLRTFQPIGRASFLRIRSQVGLRKGARSAPRSILRRRGGTQVVAEDADAARPPFAARPHCGSHATHREGRGVRDTAPPRTPSAALRRLSRAFEASLKKRVETRSATPTRVSRRGLGRVCAQPPRARPRDRRRGSLRRPPPARPAPMLAPARFVKWYARVAGAQCLAPRARRGADRGRPPRGGFGRRAPSVPRWERRARRRAPRKSVLDGEPRDALWDFAAERGAAPWTSDNGAGQGLFVKTAEERGRSGEGAIAEGAIPRRRRARDTNRARVLQPGELSDEETESDIRWTAARAVFVRPGGSGTVDGERGRRRRTAKTSALGDGAGGGLAAPAAARIPGCRRFARSSCRPGRAHTRARGSRRGGIRPYYSDRGKVGERLAKVPTREASGRRCRAASASAARRFVERESIDRTHRRALERRSRARCRNSDAQKKKKIGGRAKRREDAPQNHFCPPTDLGEAAHRDHELAPRAGAAAVLVEPAAMRTTPAGGGGRPAMLRAPSAWTERRASVAALFASPDLFLARLLKSPSCPRSSPARRLAARRAPRQGAVASAPRGRTRARDADDALPAVARARRPTPSAASPRAYLATALAGAGIFGARSSASASRNHARRGVVGRELVPERARGGRARFRRRRCARVRTPAGAARAATAAAPRAARVEAAAAEGRAPPRARHRLRTSSDQRASAGHSTRYGAGPSQ